MTRYYDSKDFKHDGRAFRAFFYADDDDSDAPWDREDGHGPVSDWRRGRDKSPGERTLQEDRGQYRFYDVAAATRIARRDGWGLSPEDQTTWLLAHGRRPDMGSMRPGEIVAEAVERDFQRLRAWCNDQWHYCGVAVRALDDDGEPIGDEYAHALWGVESDGGAYLDEVAHELASEIIAQEQRETFPVL